MREMLQERYCSHAGCVRALMRSWVRGRMQALAAQRDVVAAPVQAPLRHSLGRLREGLQRPAEVSSSLTRCMVR